MRRILPKKRALEIIGNFSRSGVLVVGDVMVDHFIWGKVSRISPEAPVPVVDVQKDSIMLGGCANVLNGIYAMGGKVYVAGVVGSSVLGPPLGQALAGVGKGPFHHLQGGDATGAAGGGEHERTALRSP